MSRPLGGYIGYDAEPTTDAAPGIWTLREAEFYQRKAQWPLNLFDPSSISGLQAWYDASDASTLYDATTGGSLVAADGGVARWEDKSGNDYHMTQGTAGRRPARKTAIQGGLDVLRFDDSDDVLFIADSDMVADVGGVTVIAAVIYSADGVVFVANTNVAAGRAYLDFTNSTDFRAGGRRLDADSFVGHSVSRASGAQVVAGVFDYTNQELAAAVDGSKSVYGSSFHSGGNTSATNSLRVMVGGSISSDGNSVNSAFGGDICELLVYTQALGDTDREAVENYLLAKWGIT